MAGRDYGVQVSAVSVGTAAQDLFEFAAADDKPIRLIGLELGQDSEMGDAAEEAIRLAIRRGNTASGSGGSTPTVRALDKHDGAAGFAAEANNTTKANTSGATFWSSAWNERISPSIWWWPDQFGVMSDQGDTTGPVVEMVTTIADALTLNQSAYVREY